jgi:hypothetical protein
MTPNVGTHQPQPNVCTHPPQAHVRRHSPQGYDPYGGFKDWLRDEFQFRCVYCLEREMWYPDRAASFSVDHVIPQVEDPTLVCEYRNLVYSCTRCNSAKQACRLLDPTVNALGEHLRLGENGLLIAVTVHGKDLIDLLCLNEEPALGVRRTFLSLIALRARYPNDLEIANLYQAAFKYPDDMPDLRTKRPPRGNTVKDSELTCYFARRERKELSDIY